MSDDEDLTAGKLLIVEYEQLKEEQRARIGFRDNLLYVTLASMATVIAAVLTDGHPALLLLLPPVAVVLGWTYLVNDEKISAIGRYVRQDLSEVIRTRAGVPPPFGWESIHRHDRYRASRKRLQLAVDLLTFVVAPVAALVVYWVNGPWQPWLIAISLAESAAVSILAFQAVRYADLKGGG